MTTQKKKQMRDILNILDSLLVEATLEPSQIIKYPERFDAFISHIQDGRAFYTASGEEVVLDPAEAERFLQLKNSGNFRGALSGKSRDGKMYPLSSFIKTAEFGGASVRPGDDTVKNKEGVVVKPTQIGITDHPIPADALADAITQNTVLASTEYGQAVIAAAQNIINGEPAQLPADVVKNEPVKKAIVDYAGEYLGVLALIYDQSSFPNKKKFLKWLGGSFNELILNFPSKSNMQIADSFASIVNPTTQHQINISSKGTGGGAAPSLSGLVVPDHVRKKKAYVTAIDFIELCQNKNLPSPTTVSQVYQAMNLLYERVPESVPEQFVPYLPWPQKIVGQVSDSLKNGTAMPEYEPLFRDLKSRGSDGGKLTYVVKNAVMQAVNGGAVPEFQAAVLEILDYNFIQQYTSANKNGTLTFTTQWPARLDGEVSLETKSGGTDPTKGGFSFKLRPKGSATATGLPAPQTGAVPAQVGATDLDSVAQRRSRVQAAPEPEKLGTEKSLGRKRQR